MSKVFGGWRRVAVLWGVVVAAFVVDVGPSGISFEPGEAEAVIGRPLTPVSYAGVARRTVRRTAVVAPVYAAARIAVLPVGCIATGGLYKCGSVTYRAMYDGPTVVYVVN